MSSPIPKIHRLNEDVTVRTRTGDQNEFDAFNFAHGQDHNIRWLSRPNRQLIQQRNYHDTNRFRISFDAENFQPEQIKIYIQGRILTINGVYEERNDGCFVQKEFEKSYDIPPNADVEAMASYITATHLLVVEIPLNLNLQQQITQMNHLNIDNDLNNQRRLSFSLNKFNKLNNQGLLPAYSNSTPSLPPTGSNVRRTSITKTTTTTTSTKPVGISPEIAELLRNTDTSVSGPHAYSTRITERRSSNTPNSPIMINQSNSPVTVTSTNNQTTSSSILTNSELTNLPIEIPPELLATGGTITIQKRKVSVIKTTDPNVIQPLSIPIGSNNEPQMTLSQAQSQPINLTERRGSKTISSANQRHMFTLEEFLQNKTWNPMIIDSPDGKKILYMRLPMKPGTTADHLKITLNGHDFRVTVDSKISEETGRFMDEQSYRQVTLFPTCDLDRLKTELKNDGFLHIQVPIKL